MVLSQIRNVSVFGANFGGQIFISAIQLVFFISAGAFVDLVLLFYCLFVALFCLFGVFICLSVHLFVVFVCSFALISAINARMHK